MTAAVVEQVDDRRHLRIASLRVVPQGGGVQPIVASREADHLAFDGQVAVGLEHLQHAVEEPPLLEDDTTALNERTTIERPRLERIDTAVRQTLEHVRRAQTIERL